MHCVHVNLFIIPTGQKRDSIQQIFFLLKKKKRIFTVFLSVFFQFVFKLKKNKIYFV